MNAPRWKTSAAAAVGMILLSVWIILGAVNAVARSTLCSAAHSHTVLSSSSVRVYRRAGKYYGCLRQSGRTIFLAAAHTTVEIDIRVTSETSTFQRSALAGDWVAWSKTVVSGSGGPSDSSAINAVELSTGLKKHAMVDPNAATVPDGLAVSPSGLLAWLTPYTLGSLPVGAGGPRQVVVSTLGGDHHPDLVVLAEDSVFALRGIGGGKFASAEKLAGTQNALQLSVADVNGDGIPDLIVGEGLSDPGVLVFPGRANGTLGPPLRTGVASLPSVDVMAVGDFNGDGHPDLVVGSQFPGYGDKLLVLLGKGDGHFRPLKTFRAGGKDDLTAALAVGDTNGDRKPDIVAGMNTKITILRGDGDGTFKQPLSLPWHEPRGPGIGTIAIRDLNRDGKPDLVFAAGAVEVMLGLGHAAFAPVKKYRVDDPVVGLSSLAVGDVNRDGIADVVAGEAGAAGVAVLDGTGKGALRPPRIYRAHNGDHVVALGDLTGTGKLDVAVGNFDSGDVSVLLNRGNGTFLGPTLNDNLFVLAPSGEHQLAADAEIPSRSLRFDQITLHWTANGRPQQLQVH